MSDEQEGVSSFWGMDLIAASYHFLFFLDVPLAKACGIAVSDQELDPLDVIFTSIDGKSIGRRKNNAMPKQRSRPRKIAPTIIIICENPLPPN